MKKWLALLPLFVASVLVAQNTTVTGTITDSDAQHWGFANYSFKLYNPNGGPIVYTATGLPPANNVSGRTAVDGSFSISIATNGALSPQGTCWIMQIQPAASSGPQILPCLTTTGGTQSITTFVNANITPPRFPIINGGPVFGYSFGEITTPPYFWYGAFFYNSNTGTCYQFDSSSESFLQCAGGVSTYEEVVALWSSCTGYLASNGRCSGTLPVAPVQLVMPTTTIAANDCIAPATVTMTGVKGPSGSTPGTTFNYAFETLPGAGSIIGWGGTGGLVLNLAATTDTLHWEVCNQTNMSVTGGAVNVDIGVNK